MSDNSMPIIKSTPTLVDRLKRGFGSVQGTSAQLAAYHNICQEAAARILEMEDEVAAHQKGHDELVAIHQVVMCIGCVTELNENDPYTLNAVKQMAIRINGMVKELAALNASQAQPALFMFRFEGRYYTGFSRAECELMLAKSNIKEPVEITPLYRESGLIWLDGLVELAKQARKELVAFAKELKVSSTIDGDWGEEWEAKEEYDRLMALAAKLAEKEQATL